MLDLQLVVLVVLVNVKTHEPCGPYLPLLLRVLGADHCIRIGPTTFEAWFPPPRSQSYFIYAGGFKLMQSPAFPPVL